MVIRTWRDLRIGDVITLRTRGKEFGPWRILEKSTTQSKLFVELINHRRKRPKKYWLFNFMYHIKKGEVSK